MSLVNSQAGLTFTNLKLQVTEITRQQDRFLLSNLDELFFYEEIDFNKDKETKINSILQAAFEELKIKNSFTSNAVSFSLPHELFITACLPFEKTLLHSDQMEEFRWQLSIIYPHLNINDFIINYFETKMQNFNLSNTAIVFAVERKIVKLISELCQRNNLKLKYIDHFHLSSNNVLTISEEPTSTELISLYIFQNAFSVLISKEGKPIFYQDIPISSLQYVSNLVQENLNKLVDEQYKIQHIYLFGDSISKSLANLLSDKTGFEFVLANPFAKINANAKLADSKYYNEFNYFFAPSAGVAFRS
jgi:Tfp pilus assembly PilM family ATPase